MSAKVPSRNTALHQIRQWLFIALLAGAPFTFNPSVSLPTYGFVSFRLGLYQLLIVVFVLLMLPILWQQKRVLRKDYLVLVPAGVLTLLAIISPFRSIHPLRSSLLSFSFVLLVMFLLSGWAYAKTLLTISGQRTLFRVIVGVTLAVGAFGIVQFAANTFQMSSLGLCAKCSASVFGFPRINGFAAEPQFFASSLLPGILLLYGYVLRSKRSFKALAAFGFLIFVLTLSLSRGGFVASATGVVALNLILYFYKKLNWQQLFRAGIVAVCAVLIGFGAMVLSATIRHQKTNPDITQATTATIVEHVSGGVISLPYNDPKPVVITPEPVENFQSPGVIEASHEERESAAGLGLKWWRRSVITTLAGLGVGNLGSYAQAQDPNLPLSFTIYMQYIFMLVEIGVVGVLSFMVLSILAISRAIRIARGATTTFSLVLGSLLIGFIVHYMFFGTYINVPYVWLYTGLALGVSATSKRISRNE